MILYTLLEQFFYGISIDLLSGHAFSRREFAAGLLVAARVMLNQFSFIRENKKRCKREEYYARITHMEREYQEYLIKKRKKGKDHE